MAVQVSTGPNSLVALGINVGDVATLYGLARRVGNWLTAASGDQDFLALLDQDETDILQRKGLVDILRFNKIWGSQLTILANGRPETFTGKNAEKNLDRFSRFTAAMVCTVAALDAFLQLDVMRGVVKNVLLQLLQTTEWGEDVIASQFHNRINSWQSAGEVRGLSGKAREVRQSLVSSKQVLDGLMPVGESRIMADFLVWLLAGKTQTYVTPSSDVAGVAVCLSKLGIDVLNVEGLLEETQEAPCRLVYSPQASYPSKMSEESPYVPHPLSREPCTSVALQHPQESLTKFPIDGYTSNRCRQAWMAGSRAAEAVGWTLVFPNVRKRSADDIKYVFYDLGKESGRTRTKIVALLEALAFVVNTEVCSELELVLQRESDATLDWLLTQTEDSLNTANMVSNMEFNDDTRINAFTVFQAFFMGYYYAIFLRMVDTSALQVKVVEGLWGYRSLVFLITFRTVYLNELHFEEQGLLVLRREDVLSIIANLFCAISSQISRVKHGSSTDYRATYNRDNWCIGIIGKRTALARSLLHPCSTRKDIGQFVLLDVDSSGIPRDSMGLVRPGIADDVRYHFDSDAQENRIGAVMEPPNEDVTFHIEADWDGDPENMLLCVRYKGRRTCTINPAVADAVFGARIVPPAPQVLPVKEKSMRKLALRDCLNRQPLRCSGGTDTFLLQTEQMPQLCYAVAYWYDQQHILRIATNCLQTAIEDAEAEKGPHNRALITIFRDKGSLAAGAEEDAAPPKVEESVRKMLLPKKGHLSRTLLGDERSRVLSY